MNTERPPTPQKMILLGRLLGAFGVRGQIKIESKDDMAKRGMPSPDRADALMLAYATPSTKTVTLGRW